jgi:UDP-N-acetyl-D-mannosaminuronate dehydrogenase
MSSTADQLLERINSRRARVGVVGLGYVGLPLLTEFARSGYTTVGIDLDTRKVTAINAGAKLSYVDPHVPQLADRQWTGGYDLVSVPPTRATFSATDCIVILTDHRTFDDQGMIDASPLIVDTRNAIKQRYPHVFRIGASNAHCEAPVAG